jgi:hypothetical protein
MQTVADRYEQKNRALRDRIAQLQGAATTNTSTPAGRGRDPVQP